MKKQTRVVEAKRSFKEFLGVTYLSRLVILEVLVAFLLVSQFPGFDAQNRVPLGVFVPLAALVYFAILHGLVFILGRFLAPVFTKPGLEILLLLISAYYLEEILSGLDSLGPDRPLWKYGTILVSLFIIWLFALCLGNIYTTMEIGS